MIRALVFDFDGLILDTEAALIAAYAAVHAAQGVAFDEAEFCRSIGVADYSFDPWHRFGAGADREALEAERRRRNREINLTLPILPGVMPLLDAASARGLPIGLASNSGHAHCEFHLGRLGLLKRFSVVACREDVPSPKPEPDLYKLVLNRLGLRGHEAIAFEDSHTGSLAAKRANLWTVAVPNPQTAHHNFAHADLRLASLAEADLESLIARFAAAA